MVEFSYVALQQDEYVSTGKVQDFSKHPDAVMELLSKGRKRRTTFVIAVVVLVAVVIAAVLYFLKPTTPPSVKASSYVTSMRPLSMESLIKGDYSPKRFNGSWISDSEILYRNPDGIILFNARTKTNKLLLEGDHEIVKQSFQYELSADHRYLMLAHSYQKMYRYTFLAYYHIVDLETKKGWSVTDMNGARIPLQLVKWAPTGNSYVYVYMNDIYLRPSAREQTLQEYRLTSTGRPGTIYNGVPDWVYEEEILSSNSALWFSPDGRHLAFATFNDSRTPVMNIPYYGVPGDLRFQYTQAVNIRYPKPGRPNPTVTLSVIDLTQVQQTPILQLDLPPRAELREPVLGQVKWAAPGQLVAVWMNRIQNEMDIIACLMENTKCHQILTYQEESGWITLPEMLVSPDAKMLGVILPQTQSEKNIGKFRHLATIDMSGRGEPKPLTSGKFTVTDLLAWDEKHIYFLATPPGKPSELALNRVRADGGATECISCRNNIPNCLYAGAEFSLKNHSYYMETCAGPVVPEINLYHKDGQKILTWEGNDKLKRRLEEVTLPESEEVVIEIDGGHEVHVQLFKPPGMDTSGEIKYPLLVQVYGGPDSNVVSQRFNLEWYSSMIVNDSIVYARIDGRGSGLKGDKTLFSIYRHLGTVEIFDQINITSHLLTTKKYLDKDRTAIWGWSYGGYAAGMALAQDKDVFKCGISVAPVTDWLLYDTLYTERFMGLPTPEDNFVGYEQASLNSKVDNLRNKKYFLIHGTLDDNVHYQQSMMLAKALEMKDILFEQQSYPDEAHGLSDVRPHLYHTLQHFLHQCFSKK
ncbi:venom dipeptidyl peptidase 4 isoform X2 [Halyomorpha halys]|uniref:venom dipeptidyl peptidase 4 isoform X2 n=1 Tax=Halyomorpha halys TaxID=286706 RepID=UPI0006D4D59A